MPPLYLAIVGLWTLLGGVYVLVVLKHPNTTFQGHWLLLAGPAGWLVLGIILLVGVLKKLESRSRRRRP